MFLYKHTFLNVKYIFSKILQRCLAWCFFWKDILKRKRNKINIKIKIKFKV